MRIAYISLHWPRARNTGVGKKIQSQVKIWNELGHHARLFMHTSTHEPASELIEADIFSYQIRGKLHTEFNRIRAARQMIIAVEAFKPDIIYLRYGMYVYPAHQLMKIAPVVEEINTNDLTQHEGLGGIYDVYNRSTRGIFLRRIHGLVTVSHELAISSAFAPYRKPTCVIANGIESDSFTPLPAPVHVTPHLVFIGSPGYLWHGIDKLVEFARRTPDVQLDLIGYDKLTEFEPLPPNLTLHGYLSAETYQAVLATADVAISSLALHRIQLEEASTLKSRECLILGLPLVIAYKDTDLDTAKYDFVLKIPNKEDNIYTHAEAIREFAYQMRGKRADRSLLENLIGAKQKEVMRLKFFEKVLKNKMDGK